MAVMNFILLAINITAKYSAPLIFGALGGVISERSGVVNIGIEGMMTIGAFAGCAAAILTGNPWLGMVAAGVGGGLLALLHGIVSITFRGDQTVSGIALNLIGPGLALFLSMLLFGAVNTPTVANKMPKILSWLNGDPDNIFYLTLNIDSTFILAIAAAVVLWFVLYRTKWGLRIRSVGEHPKAADTLGINVYAVRYTCVILSGVLAGFGGAARSIAASSQFSPATISGQGFIALAAVIFGKWSPHGAVAGCLLFGFAQALVVQLGGIDLIPSQILAMVPYILTLVVLVLFVGKSAAPKEDGLPYEK